MQSCPCLLDWSWYSLSATRYCQRVPLRLYGNGGESRHQAHGSGRKLELLRVELPAEVLTRGMPRPLHRAEHNAYLSAALLM